MTKAKLNMLVAASLFAALSTVTLVAPQATKDLVMGAIYALNPTMGRDLSRCDNHPQECRDQGSPSGLIEPRPLDAKQPSE